MLRPVAATENLNSSFEFSRHFSVLLLQKGKGNSILKNKNLSIAQFGLADTP